MDAEQLLAFLRARLAEDEQTARAAVDHEGEAEWSDGGEYGEHVFTASTGGTVAVGQWTGYLPDATRKHIARHHPARVLADVAAKRRLLYEFEPYVPGEPGHAEFWCAVRLAAVPYADHPDFRQEWRL